jgi:hypothetical protein
MIITTHIISRPILQGWNYDDREKELFGNDRLKANDVGEISTFNMKLQKWNNIDNFRGRYNNQFVNKPELIL